MLEQEIKNLAEAVRENTAMLTSIVNGSLLTSKTVQFGDRSVTETTLDVNATHGEQSPEANVDVEEKPKKKKRRTRAEIAADKQAAQDALDAEAGNTPPPPPSASDDPKVGRTVSGLAVPEDVEIGMEQGWYDYSPEGIAHAQSKIEEDVIATTMTIDDMRAELAALGATKGGMAIVTEIAKFGKKLEDVDPSNYLRLLTAIGSAPDVGTAPPPPAV